MKLAIYYNNLLKLIKQFSLTNNVLNYKVQICIIMSQGVVTR